MQAFPTSPQNSTEWFDIARYAPAGRFEVGQWIQQIAKRAIVAKAIEANDRETLDAWLPQLMSAPLSDYAFQYKNTSTAVRGLDYATGAVVPMAFADLDRLQGLRSSFPSSGLDAIDEWSSAHDELAAVRHFAHLKVDLNARDDDLHASFEAWLKAYRSKAGVPPSEVVYRKSITDETADWYLSKVLPYFDLTAWLAWSRVKMTQDQVARLLFPNDDTVDREKLGPIKKKASRILTMATAMSLSIRL
jgi:hypothetical protein